MKHTTGISIKKLTAIWAFSESGLGGIMHAFHLPFTGFLLAAFAVIIMGLIAANTQHPFKVIVHTTLLVLMVKAAISPNSPLPAYVAVSLQGLAGAILYSGIRNFKLASLLLGMFALLESALQQLFILTLLFGKSLWQAIDLFLQGILKSFTGATTFPFSWWIIAAYCLLYLAWGIYIGLLSSRIPGLVAEKMIHYKDYSPQDRGGAIATINTGSGKYRKYIAVILLLLFIAGILLWNQKSISGFSASLYVIARTVSIILLWYLLVSPFSKWLTRKYFKRQKGKYYGEFNSIISTLPEIRKTIRPAYSLAAQQSKGLTFFKNFLLLIIVLGLKE